MAKRKPPIVGLEIEPAAIHAAAVTVNGGIAIKTGAISALQSGIIRDGEVVDPERLTAALKEMFANAKGLDKRVRIGVANHKIVVRVVELPPVENEKELDAAVRFSAQDEIPMPLDTAVFDYQPLAVVDTDAGPRQRVLLVAARRDMIESVLGACRDAGLKPQGIDLSAFAMIRALGGGAAESTEPVLYLAVGGGTNVAVAAGGICLFTRVVGGGTEMIADRLAAAKNLTIEHAREWLRHVGLSTPLESIDGGGHRDIVASARELLEDGVGRIAGEIRNSLDFHQAQSNTTLEVQRAVITGAGAMIPGFAAGLSAELAMPVTGAAVGGSAGDLDPHLLTIAAGLAVEEV